MHAMYGVELAEYVIRILVTVPQECVNTHSTRRARSLGNRARSIGTPQAPSWKSVLSCFAGVLYSFFLAGWGAPVDCAPPLVAPADPPLRQSQHEIAGPPYRAADAHSRGRRDRDISVCRCIRSYISYIRCNPPSPASASASCGSCPHM